MTPIYLISKSTLAELVHLPTTGLNDDRVNPYIIEAQELDLRAAIGHKLYDDLITNYQKETFAIAYTTLVGTFTAGETVSGKLGATIKGTGRVVTDLSGVLTVEILTGSFDDATTLVGGTSAATATISSLTYGKYYYLMNGRSYIDPYNYSVHYVGLKKALAYWSLARLIENQQVTITPTGIMQKRGQDSEAISASKIAAIAGQKKSAALEYFIPVEKFLRDSNNGTITYPLWNIGLRHKKSGRYKLTIIDGFTRKNKIREQEETHIGISSSNSVSSLTFVRVSTVLNTMVYTIPSLNHKTIASVQIDNIVLSPVQYFLSGSTFTITDTDVIIVDNQLMTIFYQS